MFNYRKAWRNYFGKIPPKHVIHHINGDRTNNAFDNLVCIPNKLHGKLHWYTYHLTDLYSRFIGHPLLSLADVCLRSEIEDAYKTYTEITEEIWGYLYERDVIIMRNEMSKCRKEIECQNNH